MVARKFLTSDDLAARRKEDDEEFFNQILIEAARAITGIRDDLPIEPLSEKGTPVAPDPSSTVVDRSRLPDGPAKAHRRRLRRCKARMGAD